MSNQEPNDPRDAERRWCETETRRTHPPTAEPGRAADSFLIVRSVIAYAVLGAVQLAALA